MVTKMAAFAPCVPECVKNLQGPGVKATAVVSDAVACHLCSMLYLHGNQCSQVIWQQEDYMSVLNMCQESYETYAIETCSVTESVQGVVQPFSTARWSVYYWGWQISSVHATGLRQVAVQL